MQAAFRAAAVVMLAAAAAGAAGSGDAACRGILYLTIDTGWSSHAEQIKSILEKYKVRATFFLANELTYRGDYDLDDSWRNFWRGLVADGDAFGSHTMRHGTIRGDLPGNLVNYVVNGRREGLNEKAFCEELRDVDTRFEALTGRRLDPYWRAPGGHTSRNAIAFGEACGYREINWADAGFLGDELPSDKYPNSVLLKRALANLRDGDIIMMHLGIHSRKDPWAPELDPLIAGLKNKGYCFATIPEKYQHAARAH